MSKQDRLEREANEKLVDTIHCRVVTDPDSGDSSMCVGGEYCSSLVAQGMIMSPYGGLTIAIIKHQGTGEYHAGVAVCSERDAFDRKRGTLIARGRASKAAELGKVVYGPRTHPDYAELLTEHIQSRIAVLRERSLDGVKV